MKSEWINLSFYRFYRVGDIRTLNELRNHLTLICSTLDLKGTVLISSEGVNAMVAGTRTSIEDFKVYARDAMGILDSAFKEAAALSNPYSRMLIKIKKEIISVGDTDIQPDVKTAPRITPAELKQWLDDGRPMILLDTRNHYEVEVGTFKGARELELNSSRDFSTQAASQLSRWSQPTQDGLSKVPIVTFCTGGIRCEKASAHLLKLGLDDVYQLEGGILRYLEENGAEHFEGHCFVFDWRLAVDGNLNPVARSADPNQEFGRHRTNNLLIRPVKSSL